MNVCVCVCEYVVISTIPKAPGQSLQSAGRRLLSVRVPKSSSDHLGPWAPQWDLRSPPGHSGRGAAPRGTGQGEARGLVARPVSALDEGMLSLGRDTTV